MITEEQIRELLEPLGKVRKSGKHLIGTCPICEKPDHFFINLGYNRKGEPNAWDCKKCSESGLLYSFLKHFGKLHWLRGSDVDFAEIKSNLNVLPATPMDIDISLPDCRLPACFTVLKSNSKHPYADYLRSRKFTKADFELYQPGYTEVISKYDEYVIIPVNRDFVTKAFLGRYVGENKEAKRYLNNTGAQFGKLLFGIDEVTNSTETLIITEGLFDKVGVTTELHLHAQEEIKCVGSFGKKLTESHLAYIRKSTKVKNLVIMYDVRDAVNDMKKSGILAKKLFSNVLACFFDETTADPNEMTKDEILATLDTARPIEEFFYDFIQPDILSKKV